MSEMKDRMRRGELYQADDAELIADMARAQAILARFNLTAHERHGEQAHLLRDLLGSVGDDVVIRPTFRCDYGAHITIGAGAMWCRSSRRGICS